MNVIKAIAKNTFKEAIRDKVLYAIIGFGLVFVLVDVFFAKIAIGDLVMIRSFGLAGIYIFGSVITIFLGSSIVHKEIDRRTLYFVLSKPVQRSEVILGKFFGLLAAVLLAIFLMLLVYLVIVAIEGGGLDLLAMNAVFFQILEMAVFIAFLLFFSSFTAPLVSTLAALMLLFIGHLLPTALANVKVIGGVGYRVVQFFHFILPNLEKFNIRNLVVHNIPATPLTTLITVAYALLFIGLLLYLAILLFRKREL